MAAPAPGFEEEDAPAVVLGIPISDPEVLKKTQLIMAGVGVTMFFLATDVLILIQDKGLPALHGWDIVFWALGTTRLVALTYSGYFGVKRSSRRLLGVFCAVSAASCAVDAATAVAGQAKAGLRYTPAVVLRLLVALLYGVMAKTSLFLYRASADGALSQSSGRGHATAASSYSLLGIPMMDMEVLKATQVVFTAVGIVVTMLGVPVVLWSDALFNEEGSAPRWLLSFGFLVVLAGSGYYGVKRSSLRLLACFRCMTSCTAAVLLIIMLSTVHMCGYGPQYITCMSSAFWLAGLVTVLLAACLSAGVLRQKVSSGMVLTAARAKSQVDAAVIGNAGEEAGAGSGAELELPAPPGGSGSEA